MAFNIANKLYPEPLRTLAFGSISGTYARLGLPFFNPARLIVLQNYTDVLITFSWDGINNHLVLPSNGQMIMDISSNKSDASGELYFAQGQVIYASGSPNLGAVYLSVFFGIGAATS